MNIPPLYTARAAVLRAVAALALLLAPAARAQVVNDGATNTLNNVTNSVAGPVTVGTNGDFTQLVITNGALLTNSGNGTIGLNAGAESNSVRVTGAGSRWLLGGNLYVGSNGSFNNLILSNGGVVAGANAYLGYTVGANNNVAVVTGTNSLWTISGELHVGESGSGNRLVVSNGGTVVNSNGYLGYNSTANNNVAVVTGTGSRWTNNGDFYVGLSGSGNQLVVSNGGVVANGFGHIGFYFGANNNVAVVTGTNSAWTNSSILIVGNGGSGNQLVVSNGGVVASAFGLLGYTSTASNNLTVVTGTGSRWNNSANLAVGVYGSGNQLVVSNGGVVADGTGFLGDGSTASNNVALVAGANSLWTNSSDLYVGNQGSGNQLVVSNGGTVSAANVTVGANASSTNNRVTVDGGSLFATNAGGTGVLDIRGGTNVLNAGLIVADNLVLNNSAGFFTFNGGTLNVGSATVSNGILFTVGNGTSNATLNFTGNSTRTFGSGLVINTNATVSFGAGVLNSSATTNRAASAFTVGDGTSAATFNLLGNGTHSFSNALVIASNASLTGNGTIVGTVTNFGTIAPGNSAGSLTINGALRLQSSSLMSFELGGLIPTNGYDQVTVTSFAELAGTLSLSLLPGYLPNPKDSFTVLRYNTYSFQFANAADAPGVRVNLANNLASFGVSYSATNVTLTGVRYADNDGDGQGDLQEMAAGTDPASQASEMKITALARTGGGPVTVTFQSVPGKNYRIEYSNDLITWSVANTNTAANGVGSSTQWIDDGSQTGGLNASTTRRFYRVGLQ